MTKSIEDIWKEGFLATEHFIAPRINNLYNHKSSNLVSRMRRMFNINHLCVLVVAIVLLIEATINNAFWPGFFIFSLCAVLLLLGRKELKKLEILDSSLNCYQYLSQFDSWLNDLFNNYKNFYRIFYPMSIIAGMLRLRYTGSGEATIDDWIVRLPDAYLVGGVPWPLLACVIVPAGLVGVFAGPLYRWDMNMVYGRQLKKLNELLTEMKELRA